MKRFEKGKQYPLHFKSKKWNELAGAVEVTEIEYFQEPKEISEQNTAAAIFQIGKASIRYVDTKYYKNKHFEVRIVGYFKTEHNEKEESCLSLDNKFYFPVFLY